MGKDFNSRNDTGQSGSVPLDSPASKFAATRFPGPTFDTGGIMGPNEQCATSKEPYEAPTEPAIDSPNEKGEAESKGRDSTPRY